MINILRCYINMYYLFDLINITGSYNTWNDKKYVISQIIDYYLNLNIHLNNNYCMECFISWDYIFLSNNNMNIKYHIHIDLDKFCKRYNSYNISDGNMTIYIDKKLRKKYVILVYDKRFKNYATNNLNRFIRYIKKNNI